VRDAYIGMTWLSGDGAGRHLLPLLCGAHDFEAAISTKPHHPDIWVPHIRTAVNWLKNDDLLELQKNCRKVIDDLVHSDYSFLLSLLGLHVLLGLIKIK
jgi:hypothetical protein